MFINKFNKTANAKRIAQNGEKWRFIRTSAERMETLFIAKPDEKFFVWSQIILYGIIYGAKFS